MSNSDKELIASDGQQSNMKLFCMAHMRKKRILLMALLSFVGLLTLVFVFGIFAAFRVYDDDSRSFPVDSNLKPTINKVKELLRNKRALNKISKLSENDLIDKNVIKRNTDYENIDNFLNTKYKEINENDASEEISDEDNFIQKRSSDLKNSIKKLEETINVNEIFVKSLTGLVDDSEETANLIAKDLDDAELEIRAMDEDIVGLLETARMTDNTIHKRVRHKRETDFTSNGIDPDTLKLFAPILEEKKREKRLVQQKLAEVRDEFIRCKKSAPGQAPPQCDGIYNVVMERFREITKKFKEIEEIVEEMEHFNPSKRSDDDGKKKKKDKKKKDKKKKGKKSSEESNESSEEKKSSTARPSLISSTTDAALETTTDVPATTTEIESTTVEEEAETTTIETKESSENLIRIPTINHKISHGDSLIVQPANLFEDSTDPSLQLATTQTCPAKLFSDDILGHPKFQEDLEGPITNFYKYHENHNRLEDLVANKIERKQRGPIDDLFDDAGEFAESAKNFIEDTLNPTKQSAESNEVGKALSSKSTASSPSFKNNEAIGASGPFIALCEQLAKQGKQAPQPQTQTFEPPHNNFVPVPVPLSGFAPMMHFPATGETMKATSKVMMNPGYNMMPYPVCFVNYPQYRSPHPQYYYPGLIPTTQPGGKVDKTHPDAIDPEFIRTANGYFMPSMPGGFRPMQMPINNQVVVQNQPSNYRDAGDQPQPTYCTFLASDNANFPAHYSETTEQPATDKPEEFIDEPERSDDGDRASHFNIPTQYDIIYATYPNQLYAMNHSMNHHQCDAGKLPCFGTNQCIAKSSWCDSKVDCVDASDETACSCKARLPDSRICDGFIDCPMGSDEMGCFGCDKFQYSCYSNRKEFETAGSSSALMCYSSIEKCDGFSNCRNGKDESECSMIVKHVGAMLSYSISHSEGILHHNFKGRWYPVCKNANRWAIDACEMEVGKLGLEPFISIRGSQMPGPFIQPNFNQQNQVVETDPEFSENCRLGRVLGDENHITFVRCPQPQCGTSKLFEPPATSTREMNNSTRHHRDVEERIVGGVDAKSMEFPFIVAIYKDGNFHCGGSIYNEHWIITAAHCTRSFENHYYEVRAGILRRSSYSPSAHITKVSHVIRHPEYERATMKNDIALMKLKHHLSFNRWIRPICMPASGRSGINENWKFGPVAGTMCSTLGWGAIREKGPDPDELKVVEVPIMSKCKYAHDEEGHSICAGETFGTRDACQGDSGGPLVCKSVSNPLEWYLSGIVSHGEGCARANEPGVYTRVAVYLDWIAENTNPRHPEMPNIPRQNCPGHTCVWGGSKCIPTNQRCDGFVDCLGGEDEIECAFSLLDMLLGSNGTSVNANETSINPIIVEENVDDTSNKTVVKKDIKGDSFRCTKIPQLIHMDQRCDRIFDCEDGTDEENCTCRDHLKLAFAKLICDGHVDCADSTDELNCLKCNATEFACPHSQKCIPYSLHCNGEIDCKFREDELECLALTDGHSVMIDINGKPYMHSKGIITQNVESTWKILCDDNGDFHLNGSQIANDVCNVIGFKEMKTWKVVEMTSPDIVPAPMDPPGTIDPRSMLIRSKENITANFIGRCLALEIECVSFQSNSFAIHPIQHDKIKKNSTAPANVHQHNGNAIFFVPVNTTDQQQVIVEPANNIAVHEWNHLLDFDWPWAGEIFINGDLTANGVLLDKNWVLVDRNCLGSNPQPLHDNQVITLFGNSKHFLNIQSPYEQIAKVDCLQYVNDSNLMLLHLETSLDFNRHVIPSFLPIANESQADSRCLAVALDSNQATKSVELKIVNNCDDQKERICYKQTGNITRDVECDGETSHKTAVIMCKSKTSGWYPKAFHKLQKGFCDFLKPISFATLKPYSYEQIRKIIDHPCEKCDHHATPLTCETHRCPLGKCLEKPQLCDHKIDCHDGSDEKPEVCDKIPSDQKPCSPSEFRCRNGKCMNKTKFCDHIADCEDKSDEPSECTCFSYIRATDSSKLCDGTRHCWDKTDEDPQYCGIKCPEENSFKCGGSAFCIPLEMVCDKRADCPNGADEQFCHGIYQYDTINNYGEVLERSFGIWHTKCFPKATQPTQEELEDLCKKLGFRKTSNAMGKVINFNNSTDSNSNNSDIKEIPVKFQMHNATKVVAYTKFSAVKLNKGFTAHIRSGKPLAKLVTWDKSDHEKCHRMELKCIEE